MAYDTLYNVHTLFISYVIHANFYQMHNLHSRIHTRTYNNENKYARPGKMSESISGIHMCEIMDICITIFLL